MKMITSFDRGVGRAKDVEIEIENEADLIEIGYAVGKYCRGFGTGRALECLIDGMAVGMGRYGPVYGRKATEAALKKAVRDVKGVADGLRETAIELGII